MRKLERNSKRLRESKRQFPGCRLARSSLLLLAAAIAATVLAIVSSIYMIKFSTEPTSPLHLSLSSSAVSLGKSNPKSPEQLSATRGFTWTIQEGGATSRKHEKSSSGYHPNDGNPLKNLLTSTCIPGNNTLNLQENVTICVNGTLPLYQHRLPMFVPETNDERLFMLQPENIMSLRVDWVDWSWETCFMLRSSTNVLVARIVGIQSSSFQHFHDNALPWIYQARQGFDAVQSASRCEFEERILFETPTKGSKILYQEWEALGFTVGKLYPTVKYKQVVGMTVARKRYPRDKDQVRVHPVHVRWLRSVLPPQKPQSDKVVWISRLGAKKNDIFARQCKNEETVVQYLRQHTHNFVMYNPSKLTLSSLEDVVDLFGDACAIVGLHGGGMYNQFFANDKTTVVELFPVNKRGLIHGQQTQNSIPKQAHRAIWHNSNLLKQPYWRVHFESDNAKEFAIDTSTMETVVRALELSGCAQKAR